MLYPSAFRALVVSVWPVLFATLSFAQPAGPPQQSEVAECRAQALDTSVQMPDRSTSDASIVFSFKNITGEPCAFRRVPPVGAVVKDSNTGIAACVRCNADPSTDDRALKPEVILMPAATAEEVVDFHTAADCPTVSGLSAAPSITVLLGPPEVHICPSMRVRSFRLTNPSDQNPAGSSDAGTRVPSSVKLSSELDTVFIGNTVRLRIEREDVGEPRILTSQRCPSLISRFRDIDGETRFEYLFYRSGGCSSGERQTTAGRVSWSFPWGACCVGKDFTLDIAQEFDGGKGKIASVRSNTIAIKVVDPKKIQRTWGHQVDTVAANVTLDQHTYEIGQDVPLHIATATFAKDSGIWGTLLSLQGISISLRDPDGNVSQRAIIPAFNSGDPSPRPYRLGEPWIVEWSLREMLPDRVGTYTVWVSWRPLVGLSEGEARPATFTVDSNPVEFSVVTSVDR